MIALIIRDGGNMQSFLYKIRDTAHSWRLPSGPIQLSQAQGIPGCNECFHGSRGLHVGSSSVHSAAGSMASREQQSLNENVGPGNEVSRVSQGQGLISQSAAIHPTVGRASQETDFQNCSYFLLFCVPFQIFYWEVGKRNIRGYWHTILLL